MAWAVYLRAEECLLTEASLQEVALLSGGDHAVGLYPKTAGSTGDLTGEVWVRGIGIGVLPTDRPGQDVIWHPYITTGDAWSRVSAGPEEG